jgi:hypothetical protein
VIGSNNGTNGNEYVVIGDCQPQFASNPGEFEVVGRDIWSNGTPVPSDQRLKKDIKQIDNAVEKILKLNGITYNYKSKDEIGLNLSSKRHSGIIAQELEDNFDFPLVKSNNGYYGVDYLQIIPLLIEGFKEMHEEIINLKSKYQTENENQKDSKNTAETSVLKGQLSQNIPNPTGNSTLILYKVFIETNQIELKVYDMSGNLKKQVKLFEPEGEVEINTTELKPGIYAYTLNANHATLDTKTMVISK